MVATAYTLDCAGCSGVPASGRLAEPYAVTVAASPAWALGTCLEARIDGVTWTRLSVEDRGGDIDRPTELDILVPTREVARAWGRRTVKVRYCDDYTRTPKRT
jgi:3D (Asp-Asp-Asp) domain-containing protein